MAVWTTSVPTAGPSYPPVRGEERTAAVRESSVAGRARAPAGRGTQVPDVASWASVQAESVGDDRRSGQPGYQALNAQQATEAYQSRASLVSSGFTVNEMRTVNERRTSQSARSTYVSREYATGIRTYDANMRFVFGNTRAPADMRVEMLI